MHFQSDNATLTGHVKHQNTIHLNDDTIERQDTIRTSITIIIVI